MFFTYKWKTNQNIVFSKEVVGRWTDLCRAPLLYPPLSTNHRTQKHCFGILLEDPVFCEVLSQSGWKKRPSNWGWQRSTSALSFSQTEAGQGRFQLLAVSPSLPQSFLLKFLFPHRSCPDLFALSHRLLNMPIFFWSVEALATSSQRTQEVSISLNLLPLLQPAAPGLIRRGGRETFIQGP